MKKLNEAEIIELKKAQKDEMVGTEVYEKLAKSTKDPHNAKILKQIAQEEKKHANILKKYTGVDIKVNKFRVLFYVLVSRIFGLTFGVKLQERGFDGIDYRYFSITFHGGKRIFVHQVRG